MRVVTGGAGMIGSAMVWQLNQLGVDDILIVDHLGTSEKWKNLVNRRFREYIPREDFIAQARNDKLPGDITVIFHMGACSCTTERDVEYLFRNNLEYSKTLAAYAVRNGIRFINASSAATYGNGNAGFDDNADTLEELRPLNAYGYAKHLFDLWAQRAGIFQNIVSLKFFNVYGPNEYHKGDMRSVVAKAFEEIRHSGRMTLFAANRPEYANGGQMRDFIYIKDCVAAMWWLADHPKVNGVFNLGSGKARTWNDLAHALFAALDIPGSIDYTPMPDHLRGKYQNFTEAAMGRLHGAGCPLPAYSLEQGIADYVRGYLLRDDPYL